MSEEMFSLIKESLWTDATYYGQMSLKEISKTEEYFKKAEKYLEAIDFLRTVINWVDINKEQPKEEGKYIVKTLTSMKNIHKIESKFTITNGKGSFNVTNQIVTHWLKENNHEKK